MRAKMTHRERVVAALNHQEPDRVPIDLSQCSGDGITVSAYQSLLRHLNYQERPIRIASKQRFTAEVDEDVLHRFDVDFRIVRMGPPDRPRLKTPLPPGAFQDEWGVVRTLTSDGLHYGLTTGPFVEDATLSALDRFPWPDPDDPGRYRGLREKARRLREETDYAVVFIADSSFFIRSGEMRGLENFFADLSGNAEFITALLDRFIDTKLAIAERALQEVGDYIDVVHVAGDDLGSTSGLLISPNMYRSVIKPRQKRIFDFYKARTAAKRFFHCDGAIVPFIGDLIEAGAEILNPVQISAAGMGDTHQLKADFGDRLSFWGAIDTHDVLPFGSVEDVREEVRRRIRDLGPSGGYVLSPVSNIQSEVPAANVVAMYDAANEVGWYPLG